LVMHTSFAWSLLLLPLAMASGQLPPDGPTEAELNPNRAHISIILPDFGDRGEAPNFALYATPNLRGSPAIRLTGDGLFIGGKLACSWPGGRFDGSNARGHLMVLGYTDDDATNYRGCPAGTPIKSFWSFHDGQYPRLYIEVAARRGSLIETRQGQTRYYFDLNQLQGDPAVRGKAIDAELSRVVRPKGFTAWSWVESIRDSERRASAALAQLRKDRTFSAFVSDVQACLTSPGVPGCFTKYVKPEFYYSDLWASTNQPHATPAEFVDFLWRQPANYGVRPWDQLVACFTSGSLTNASKDEVRFETDEYYCGVARVGGRWRLASFAGRP
jgi:hypothetical protein